MIFGVAQSVKTRISSKRMGFGRISINSTGRQSNREANNIEVSFSYLYTFPRNSLLDVSVSVEIRFVEGG